MNKQCTICEKEKPVGEFAWKNESKKIRASECKYCHNKMRKLYYEKNKAKEIKQAKKRREDNKQWIRQYKDRFVCNICGEKHISTLILCSDEIDEKDIDITKIHSLGWNKKRIEKTIKEKIVRCSNCYRKYKWSEATTSGLWSNTSDI